MVTLLVPHLYYIPCRDPHRRFSSLSPSGKNLNSASWSRVYVGESLWYIGWLLKSSNGIQAHPVNLSIPFSAKMDMLMMFNIIHFSNINSLNMILFSQLTRFGKFSFFYFRPSFLSPDALRSIGCIGCKQIFLADAHSIAGSPSGNLAILRSRLQ